ncbi:putative kinesin [Trypanosoma grayi]|uniref:putative kinesin n=1 Tax=Trypanosoma grayi TaxID=71804 RepID=UPI0004F4B90F|nr:putative kinesin [Trypanosoma grayi]KEG14602.1 putative kinesin [Trypanosoma grayi]
MQLGDPGAPTKKARARGCVFGEEDELSATCTTWIPCHHQDMMHGNKSHHTQNKYNNSISFPYDSSVPSHITPLDEVGDSIDLAEHLSHLVVVASPTQKRLVFSNVLDDCGNTGRGDARVGGSRTTPCSGRGMQLLQRSKRFLEEVDSNRDAASACSLPGAMTPDVHRKCRRVDTGEDEKSNSNGSSTARLIGGSCGGVVH